MMLPLWVVFLLCSGSCFLGMAVMACLTNARVNDAVKAARKTWMEEYTQDMRRRAEAVYREHHKERIEREFRERG